MVKKDPHTIVLFSTSEVVFILPSVITLYKDMYGEYAEIQGATVVVVPLVVVVTGVVVVLGTVVFDVEMVVVTGTVVVGGVLDEPLTVLVVVIVDETVVVERLVIVGTPVVDGVASKQPIIDNVTLAGGAPSLVRKVINRVELAGKGVEGNPVTTGLPGGDFNDSRLEPSGPIIDTDSALTFVMVVFAIDTYSMIGATNGAVVISIILTVEVKVTPSPPGLMFGIDGRWRPLNSGSERYNG